MDIECAVQTQVQQALAALDLPQDITLERPPKPEMGDFALPCFPFARVARKNPAVIAQEIAAQIETGDLIESAAGEGPYLNLRLCPATVTQIVLQQALEEGARFGGNSEPATKRWMVEYSAPNTNKPLHLGHVRNNLLGCAVSKLLAFVGHEVIPVNLINDRGIHICKSMLAYERFGQGETPQSTHEKGDHFVGRYYVRFDQALNEEYNASGTTQDKQTWFNEGSELGEAARTMLRRWEAGDPATVELWKTMNSWVYEGFNETYERMGVSFDRVYYESETYLLGKEIVENALSDGHLQKREDGSIVCDLEQIGKEGQKVLLRSDGTSVYMTQDLGTAIARFDEYGVDRLTYVVANEQDYHFEVLFGILGLLRPELKGTCHHLNYGMVNLPDGRMKSREGTVVDADDLMDEMKSLARDEIVARDPERGLSAEEIERRAEIIGQSALRYYLLNFTPRTSVKFDPKKSVDFLGQTGPYCLYSYARVQSLFRKAGRRVDARDLSPALASRLTSPLEQSVLRELRAFPDTVLHAAQNNDTSKITEQVYRIAKSFSGLYNDRDHQIVANPDRELETARLLLAMGVGNALETGLTILGFDLLDAM